ncbi:hypothetical protein BU24DRAFT_423895 [Aaosphaeria arxii CBS 175.79]|uniref:Uncharacterized protein n=1 Tax=Aaosphaeria arxii CBS 175.79 TaxID=1450172 RepID=A0A6A5XPY9_9PLEO|nr:uncharacterized protein BU24DRAFT_423895 [Aaosphaeria arxii CBS 175.79]KAF2014976.1 hypothetical protein BU24DRAFT_423895 [Aaosphaeria arxii CBS 175.79]
MLFALRLVLPRLALPIYISLSTLFHLVFGQTTDIFYASTEYSVHSRKLNFPFKRGGSNERIRPACPRVCLRVSRLGFCICGRSPMTPHFISHSRALENSPASSHVLVHRKPCLFLTLFFPDTTEHPPLSSPARRKHSRGFPRQTRTEYIDLDDAPRIAQPARFVTNCGVTTCVAQDVCRSRSTTTTTQPCFDAYVRRWYEYGVSTPHMDVRGTSSFDERRND